ncbi:MAG: hypothetical protein AAF907_14560, partial [Planctomycetota bacterium]
LAAKPELIANDYWEVQRSFDRAGRLPALMKAVGETDPADWGSNSYAISNLLSNSLSEFENDSQAGNPAVDAFQSIWKRHPQSRAMLFASVNQIELVAADGVYEYAVEQLLGKAFGRGGVRPNWDALSQVRMWSTNPTSLAMLVLDAAKERGALEEFTETIRQEVKDHPNWHPGRGLLASALVKSGKNDEARKEVEALLALPEKDRPQGQGAWLLSVQLGDDELADLSLTLMRAAVDSNATTPYSNNGFAYSPQRRLVDLLVQGGQKDEARDYLLDAVFDPQTNEQSFQSFRFNNPQYAAQQDVQSWSGIGSKLLEIGYPMEALRVLNHAKTDAIPRAGAYANSWEVRQLDETMQQVRGALTPAVVAADLQRRLTAEKAALANGEELSDEPLLDLFVSAVDGGEELAKAEVGSGLIAALIADPDQRQVNGRTGEVMVVQGGVTTIT